MPKSAKQRAAIKDAGNNIVSTPGQIVEKGPRKWRVRSQTVCTVLYTVILGIKGLMCDCPQCQFGKGLCKHVAAIDVWLAKKWNAIHKKTIKIIDRPTVKCQYGCKKNHVVQDGTRDTKRKGRVQKYLCRICGRRFSGILGLKRRHASSEVIADALSLASKGMSLSKITGELARKGLYFDRSTIYRWVAWYGPLMERHTLKFRPWTGYRWHCDELRFLIFGSEAFLFAVMDYSTRFVLSSTISPEKFGAKPLGMFMNAAERAGCVPWVFVTDGLKDFIKPVRKAFWCRKGRRLVHVADIHMQNEFNHNNPSTVCLSRYYAYTAASRKTTPH